MLMFYDVLGTLLCSPRQTPPDSFWRPWSDLTWTVHWWAGSAVNNVAPHSLCPSRMWNPSPNICVTVFPCLNRWFSHHTWQLSKQPCWIFWTPIFWWWKPHVFLIGSRFGSPFSGEVPESSWPTVWTEGANFFFRQAVDVIIYCQEMSEFSAFFLVQNGIHRTPRLLVMSKYSSGLTFTIPWSIAQNSWGLMFILGYICYASKSQLVSWVLPITGQY